MLITEMIKRLEDLKESVGDVPVFHRNLEFKVEPFTYRINEDDLRYYPGDYSFPEGVYI